MESPTASTKPIDKAAQQMRARRPVARGGGRAAPPGGGGRLNRRVDREVKRKGSCPEGSGGAAGNEQDRVGAGWYTRLPPGLGQHDTAASCV